MAYNSKKYIKKFPVDQDNSSHIAKRRKKIVNTKQVRLLDNILKTKNINKILTFDENY